MRLAPGVVAALIQLDLFRLWVPRRVGGRELDLPGTLRVYEAAAYAEGSVGWAVMIGSGGGLFAAYLDPDAAYAIYSRPESVIAGSGAPEGRAERVAGGYRATGHWRYASGAQYATTFTANCLVTEDGTQVVGKDGQPLVRAMAFDRQQVSVMPAWDTSGMRGTGSDDFEVSDAFVPGQRTFSVFTDPPLEAGVLYRLPFGVLTELPVASVTLGIARHALDAFRVLARHKRSPGLTVPLAPVLAGDPLTQGRFAESYATWQSVKAGLELLAGQAWQTALSGRQLTSRELAEITAGCVTAVARLRSAVGELITLAGMTGIQMGEDLARAWRDLQAVAMHGSVSARRLATAGSVLLSE